jgi:hypothetical protein
VDATSAQAVLKLVLRGHHVGFPHIEFSVRRLSTDDFSAVPYLTWIDLLNLRLHRLVEVVSSLWRKLSLVQIDKRLVFLFERFDSNAREILSPATVTSVVVSARKHLASIVICAAPDDVVVHY